MYAINNTESNIKRTLDRIQSMIRLHQRLGDYFASLEISFENRSVVLRGELPSDELRGELVPTIRQACNKVQVN